MAKQRPTGRVKQQDTVEEPQEPVAPAGAAPEPPEPVAVESLPDARDVRAVPAAVPAPQAPAAVGRPVPPEVAAEAEDMDAEAEALRAQGEVVTFLCKRGGNTCNLSIPVSVGVPVQKDAHGRIVPGTAIDARFIHFGPKSGNPQGFYRTSDPDEIALIEASEPFRRGQITRTDIEKARASLAAIALIEAQGIPVDPAKKAELAERAAPRGNAPQVQHGARTTRTTRRVAGHDPGTSRPFGGVDTLLADPRIANALREG